MLARDKQSFSPSIKKRPDKIEPNDKEKHSSLPLMHPRQFFALGSSLYFHTPKRTLFFNTWFGIFLWPIWVYCRLETDSISVIHSTNSLLNSKWVWKNCVTLHLSCLWRRTCCSLSIMFGRLKKVGWGSFGRTNIPRFNGECGYMRGMFHVLQSLRIAEIVCDLYQFLALWQTTAFFYLENWFQIKLWNQNSEALKPQI